MLGTFINVAGVLLGGLLGLLIGSRLPSSLQDTLMVTGVSVLFLGLSGTLEKMLVVSDQGLSSQGGMVLIISLTLGTIIGELLGIERAFENLGTWLKTVSRSEGDSQFIEAFLATSLTICIGAMAIIGPLTEGLTGDYSIQAAKAMLDLIVVLIITASKGKGAIFAALPVFLLQGTVTLMAQLLAPYVTTAVLSNISLVGNVLIFCVGLNLVFGKMIKVANLLPAVLLAVAFAVF